MNLVQRMVAENLQSVTSQELAEAAGMTHKEMVQFLTNDHEHVENDGKPLTAKGNGYILTVNETFAAIVHMELSPGFYDGGETTPADDMKADLKGSFVDVLMTLLKAEERVTGKKRNLFQEFLERKEG